MGGPDWALLMSTIETFIAEVRSSPKVAAAIAADSKWAEQVDGIGTALHALWQLGDTDAQALELCDEAYRIMQTPIPLKQRFLGILDVLVAASKAFDPGAWGRGGGVGGENVKSVRIVRVGSHLSSMEEADERTPPG
jgi:hypothetical protein